MVQGVVRSQRYGIAIPTRFIELESFQTDEVSRDRKDTLHHGFNEYDINGGADVNGSVDVVYATIDGFDAMEISTPLAFHDRTDVSERICVPAEIRTVVIPAEIRTTISTKRKGTCA